MFQNQLQAIVHTYFALFDLKIFDTFYDNTFSSSSAKTHGSCSIAKLVQGVRIKVP